MVQTLHRVHSGLFVVLGALLAWPAFGWAQAASGDFDPSRLMAGSGRFETFHVAKTQPLSQALSDGTISDEMPVLVTETATGSLALLTDQLAFHHLAQGTEAGQPWMVSF